MSPKDFKSARTNKLAVCTIYNRPYFPNLVADATCTKSIAKIAAKIVNYQPNENSDIDSSFDCEKLSVSRVSGGITNILYRVSNFDVNSEKNIHGYSFTSVLVRIFGAEGMIDRDVETSAYASLCDANIAYKYLGRFANGRIEGWLDGYRPLETIELSSNSSSTSSETTNTLSLAISEQISNLHVNYHIQHDLEPYFSLDKPGMWDQLFSWLKQAQNSVKEKIFKGGIDEVNKAELLFMKNFNVEHELHWLKSDVVPQDAEVVFCHNDLLAANIMMKECDDKSIQIQLIDFEYGGTNFAAFDIANHFNEYAGGTEDGIPDYSLFPSKDAQSAFIKTYLLQREKFRNQNGSNDEIVIDDGTIDSWMEEVQAFVLANHLYWGLWAVNQAAVEGCDEFNYLLYAKNRFQRYQDCKE